MRLARDFALALVLVLLASAAHAQARVACESRNFQYQFCPVDSDVTGAFLVTQRSRSACLQGQSWGWTRRGIWVTNGCSGVFDVQGFRPPPPSFGERISCDSRNFQHQFCPTGTPVINAQLVRQRSRSACILGRSWGWSSNGVWVSDGCQGDFSLQTSFRPLPPPGPGVVVCESSGFRYNFCGTGRIRNAQLVRQLSQTTCVQGRNWGVLRDGIWVDNGCSATFRIIR
jgi:hypothetical protein